MVSYTVPFIPHQPTLTVQKHISPQHSGDAFSLSQEAIPRFSRTQKQTATSHISINYSIISSDTTVKESLTLCEPIPAFHNIAYLFTTISVSYQMMKFHLWPSKTQYCCEQILIPYCGISKFWSYFGTIRQQLHNAKNLPVSVLIDRTSTVRLSPDVNFIVWFCFICSCSSGQLCT
jgi:hypothetical protein